MLERINWATLAQWVTIAGAILTFSWVKVRKDAEQEAVVTSLKSNQAAISAKLVSLEANQVKIEKKQITPVNIMTRYDCDLKCDKCNSDLSKTLASRDTQIVRLHSRLDAMDGRRELAVTDRNKKFSDLQDDIGQTFTQIAGLKGTMVGIQKSLDTVISHILSNKK